MKTRHGNSEPARVLADCRERIDRIDAAVLALLRERVRTAIEAGHAKAVLGEPLITPAREAEILRRLALLDGHPLEAAAVARIFRAIIEETRHTQKKIILGAL